MTCTWKERLSITEWKGGEHETCVEGKRCRFMGGFFFGSIGYLFSFNYFLVFIPYFLFFSFILLTKFVFYSSYDWSRLLPCNRLLHLVDVCLNNYRGKRGKMFLVLANDMKL